MKYSAMSNVDVNEMTYVYEVSVKNLFVLSQNQTNVVWIDVIEAEKCMKVAVHTPCIF